MKNIYLHYLKMWGKYSIYGFVIIIILSNSLLANHGDAQNIKSVKEVFIDFQVDEISMEEVFQKIEAKTDYKVFYRKSDLRSNTEKISIDLQEASVEQILIEISRQANIGFKQVNNTISVKTNIKQDAPMIPVEIIEQVSVSGTITDENGEALPGATIQEKGTTNGTITDVEGNYSISVPDNAILTFSFVGYETQELTVDGRSVMNIQMTLDDELLEEVVVIGYGTQKKSDLTGAVSTIKSGEIEKRNAVQLSQALQGMVPGLMVTRSNNAPGSTATVRVRGITTIGDSNPLIIVDGVPIRSINDVNPNDIENISVLKDAASAAIYGSRAASGVIVITTKRASDGQLQLDYNYEAGFETPTMTPEVVGVRRYMEVLNEYTWNGLNNTGSEFPVFAEDLINDYPNLNASDPNQYPITDWSELIFKERAPRQSHLISMTAGGKSVKSKTTVGYDKVEGLYQGLGYDRITGRTGTDFKINDYLDASLDMYLRYSITDRPNVSERDIIYFGRISAPIYAALWDDGRIAEGKIGDNIYAQLVAGGRDKTKATFLTSRAALNFTPIQGLKFSTVFSPQLYTTKTKAFARQVPYYSADDPTIFGGYIRNQSLTSLTESRNESVQLTTQLLANYSKTFGSHSLTTLVGFESFFLNSENLSITSQQLSLNDYPYMDLANINNLSTGGNAVENAYNSYFGRLTYSFKDRYLVQANFRMDGSSRFFEDYRWGSFPSVSVGWVISEEGFLRESNVFSFLKLRGSWGRLGNERIGNYPYQSTIRYSDALFNQSGTIVSQQTAAQTQYAIRDISWETTESYDIGVDMAFLENRLNVEFDYYEKTTVDMLLPLEIPDFIGFDNPDQNTGKMYTKGWDVSISYNNQVGDLKYSISANLSDFKSEMGDLGGIEFLGDKVKVQGSQFDEWYGYLSDGLFQTQTDLDASAVVASTVKVGDIKYRDISGPDGVPDGVISPDYDRVLLGGSLPRYMYGANLNLNYKGFDLGIVIQGVGKQNSMITGEMVQPIPDGWGNVPAIIEGKYWSHYNTEAQNLAAVYPLLSSAGRTINNYASDFWMFNGKYLRIKAITLGYSIPEVITEKLNIKDVRLYTSLNDVFTFSQYPKGWDPEVSATGYPITTSLLFGISVKF